jgi:exodeoxyribonuclease-3
MDEMTQNSTLFRVATFNTNSLRARLHVVIPWLVEHKVDVLCLQETKVQDADFPDGDFEEIGYSVVHRGQKSYNGVAVASRHDIGEVVFGFDDPENAPEDEARLVRCVIRGISIVNAYAPQGRGIDHPYFQIKLRWFRRLRELLEKDYSRDTPLLLCGDLNIAPGPMDVYSPETLGAHVCFHPDAREALKDLTEWGLVDIFRKFNPGPNEYTFFDYRVPNAVKRGIGWRIDHILGSRPMDRIAVRSSIDMRPRLMERPSDHTFLIAEFKRP